MSRPVWGLWVFLVVFTNAVACEEARAADEPVAQSVESLDDREASFLPPPETLLKVEPLPVAVAGPSAEKLTTPPPFTPKAEPKPQEAPKQVTPPVVSTPAPAPVSPPVTVESVVEKIKDSASGLAQPQLPAGEPAPSVVVVPQPAPSVPAPAKLEAAPLGDAVAKTALADVDPETLGLLSPQNGGLGTALWKDMDRSILDRLMPAVALPTPSATMNDLARRMFLTTAAAPRHAADKKPARSLLSQRIEALMSLGAVTDAWKLASLADPKLVDDVTLRLLTEAALIGPDSKEVCDKVPSLIAAHATKEDTGGEWQKSLLVCQLRAGDTKAVQLGVDLMREQNAKDSVFLSLINKNVLAGSKMLPRQLTPMRPLTLAVLRQLGLPLPPELYPRAEASMIPEMLRAKSSDEKARVLLAEKAATMGILTVAQLGDVYKDIAFTPDEISKANTSTEASPLSRAMAYQALVNEQAPQKKIDLVQRVIAGLAPSALTGVHGPLISNALDTIPVIADYNAFAVSLARTFALAGKPDKAMAWLKLARASAAQSSEIKAQLGNNWPLFVLSGLVADGEYAQGLKDWLDSSIGAEGSEDGNVVHERRSLSGNVLLLLGASGYAIGEEAWQRVLEPQPPTKQLTPSTILVERMAQAAGAGRKGETILLGLLLEGGGAESATPFAVRLETLRTLRQAGLTAESQAYAREILVGLGK